MTCDKSPETVGGGGGGVGGGDLQRKCYGFIDVLTGCPRTYPLTKRAIFVGRDRKCEIRLSNEKVSREQCVLLAEEDDNGNCQMYLMNLTTRLTTFHESRVLETKEKARLCHGDRLKLCGTELRYRLYGNEVPPPARPLQSSREKLRKIVAAASEKSESASNKPQLDKSMLEILKVLKAKATKKAEMSLARSSSAPDLMVLTSLQSPGPVPVAKVGAHAPLLSMRKRGGSMPETDMRKAVLQRCFRRAFRERLNQVAKTTAATTEMLASPPRAKCASSG